MTRGKVLRKMLARQGGWLALALGLGVGAAGLGAIEPLFYQRLVDLLVARASWSRGEVVLGGLAAVLAGGKLLQAGQTLAVNRVRFTTSFELSSRVLGRIFARPLAFHQESGTGYLLTRVDRGVAALGQILSDGLQTLLPNLASLGLMVILLVRLSPRLAVVALAPMPLFLWAAWRGARAVAGHEHVVQEGWSRLYSRVGEVLGGIKTVKSVAGEEHELGHYRREARIIFSRLWRQVWSELGFGELQGALAVAGRLGVAVYGFALVQGGRATPGTWVAAVSFAGLLYAPLAGLAGTCSRTTRGFVAAAVALDFLEDSGIEPADSAVPAALSPQLPTVRGVVEFENVSYAYSAPAGSLAWPALREVSFRVEAGETVAVIGPSGGGKTTLMDLLLKFHRPTAGRILVDGRDLAEINSAALRRQMAVVLQDPLLLGGTVAENLTYGWDTPRAEPELWEALRAAQAADFVRRLPQGLQTRLGERGARLSGGEKQRLAIARALLRTPRILILDEATAHLDAAGEAALHRALEELMRGRTTFVISHRLASLKASDRILVIEGGRLSEQGTAQALAASGGFFAQWGVKPVAASV